MDIVELRVRGSEILVSHCSSLPHNKKNLRNDEVVRFSDEMCALARAQERIVPNQGFRHTQAAAQLISTIGSSFFEDAKTPVPGVYTIKTHPSSVYPLVIASVTYDDGFTVDLVLALTNNNSNIWKLFALTEVFPSGVLGQTFVSLNINFAKRIERLTQTECIELFKKGPTLLPSNISVRPFVRPPIATITTRSKTIKSRPFQPLAGIACMDRLLHLQQEQDRIKSSIVLLPEQEEDRNRVITAWRKDPKRGFLFAHEMGFGKMILYIATAMDHPSFYEEQSRFLIIVPRSLVRQWIHTLRETFRQPVEQFTRHSNTWINAKFVIVTPQTLRIQYAMRTADNATTSAIVAQNSKIPPLLPYLQLAPAKEDVDDKENPFEDQDSDESDTEMEVKASKDSPPSQGDNIYDFVWQVVGYDEPQLFMCNSLRTLNVKGDGQNLSDYDVDDKKMYLYKIPAVAAIATSGTPLQNSYRDLASICLALHSGPCCNPQFWRNVSQWGAIHIAEWRKLAIRRTVHANRLPFGIQNRVVNVPLTQRQESAETIILNLNRQNLEKIVHLRRNSLSTNLVKGDIESVSKLPAPMVEADVIDCVAHHLFKVLESGDYRNKYLVFSEWRDALIQIREKLLTKIDARIRQNGAERKQWEMFRTELSSATIYSGKLNSLERMGVIERARDSTTNAGACILFLTVRTGSVGLNLQFASTVIYVGEWYHDKLEEQANRRVHRPGQTKPVVAIKFTSVGGVGTQAWIKSKALKKGDASKILLDILTTPSQNVFTPEQRQKLAELGITKERIDDDVQKFRSIKILKSSNNPNSGMTSNELIRLATRLYAITEYRFKSIFPTWPKERVMTFYRTTEVPLISK